MNHESQLARIIAENPQDSLQVARAYLALGFCPIPVKPGKKKAACHWERYQTERPDDATLRRWFKGQVPIALMMGDSSGGLVCRDFDNLDAYHRWAADHPALAKTLPTVATPRPGRHVYARATMEQIHSIGKACVHLGDGELRLRACYCLAPPSLHPSGAPYELLIDFPDELPVVDLEEAGFRKSYSHATESHGEAQRRQRTLKTTETTEAMNRGLENPPPPPPTTNGSVISVPLCCTQPNAIERAIAESLPTEPGKRNKQVFELARALKAIPSLAGAAVNDLKEHVRRWHERAIPVITTQPFEETWIDFIRAWQRVRFPKGTEPIGLVFEIANGADPPAVAAQYEQAELRLLVSVCRELQRTAGAGPFFLDCRAGARLLKVDHTTVWRWLSILLVTDEVLEIVERGSRARRKANRYRYLLEL